MVFKTEIADIQYGFSIFGQSNFGARFFHEQRINKIIENIIVIFVKCFIKFDFFVSFVIGSPRDTNPKCKGQFISKEPSVAEDSPKKRTNEFVFFYQTAFCVVKRRLSTKSEFVRSFFGRNHKTF